MRPVNYPPVKQWLSHRRFPRSVAGSILLCFATLIGESGCVPSSTSSSGNDVVPTQQPAPAQILGVGTHVGGRSIEQDFSVAATIRSVRQLGLNSVRDDLAWSSFQSDNPAQDPIRNAPLLSLLRALPGRPVLDFGLGNDKLNQGRLPRGPDELRQYQQFIRRAYTLVQQFHPILEVWNEWNLGSGTATRDKGSAEDYVAIAKAASEALSDEPNRPDLLVGSGGDDAVGWRWTMDIIRLGVLRYGTGLAVHIYNHCGPVNQRNADNVVDSLRDLRAKMTAAGAPADYPVYVTETGWPTYTGSCGLSQQAEAENIARLLIEVRQLSWVKGVWLYDLRDDGVADNREARFGLFDHAYQPKPAACAVARYTRQFSRVNMGSWGMAMSCPS